MDNKETQLLAALKLGDLDKADRLLDEGANPNCADHQQRTPLHWASSWEALDLMKKLCALGAEVNAKDNEGLTPLMVASGNPYSDAQ